MILCREDLDNLKMKLEYHTWEECSGHPSCKECEQMEREIEDLEELFEEHD